MHSPKQKIDTKNTNMYPWLWTPTDREKFSLVVSEIFPRTHFTLPDKGKGSFLFSKFCWLSVHRRGLLPSAGTWTPCRCARPPARWTRTRWTWAARTSDPCLRDHLAVKEKKSRATFLSAVNCSSSGSETAQRSTGLPDWVLFHTSPVINPSLIYTTKQSRPDTKLRVNSNRLKSGQGWVAESSS